MSAEKLFVKPLTAERLPVSRPARSTRISRYSNRAVTIADHPGIFQAKMEAFQDRAEKHEKHRVLIGSNRHTLAIRKSRNCRAIHNITLFYSTQNRDFLNALSWCNLEAKEAPGPGFRGDRSRVERHRRAAAEKHEKRRVLIDSNRHTLTNRKSRKSLRISRITLRRAGQNASSPMHNAWCNSEGNGAPGRRDFAKKSYRPLPYW